MSRRRVTECQAARNSQLVLRAPGGPVGPSHCNGMGGGWGGGDLAVFSLGEWSRAGRDALAGQRSPQLQVGVRRRGSCAC